MVAKQVAADAGVIPSVKNDADAINIVVSALTENDLVDRSVAVVAKADIIGPQMHKSPNSAIRVRRVSKLARCRNSGHTQLVQSCAFGATHFIDVA